MPHLRRYDSGRSLPILDTLRKLALALSVSTDTLAFDKDERGADDDLRLQFEGRLNPEEKRILKVFIEGILLQHEANGHSQRLAQAG